VGSYSESREQILSGKLTVRDRVQGYLNRISHHSNLNAFVNIYADDALAQADALDQAIATGKPVGRAAGMVVVLKDNISVEGKPLSCGSHVLDAYEAVYSSYAAECLIAEGAIIIAHSNMDEFAMGSSNESSYYGPVINPHDLLRVPGGSSGGSAVATAAELCDVALGSETGGSVRQPAAFTGVLGLKPTYGRVSRRGLVAFGSSLDQISPFARSAEDLALVFSIIAKHDAADSTSADVAEEDYSQRLNQPISGLKIGIADAFFTEGLAPDIRAKIDELKKQLAAQGAEFVPINLPHIKYAIAVYYILATAEASSNLSRYDGVRYGLRQLSENSDLHDMYAQTRGAGFGEEVKRRIMLGTFVLSHGYYDAYYRKAQKVRRLMKNDFDQAFAKCDLILSPTTPTTAFKLGEFDNDPLALYLADTYTAPSNLAGNSAISIPYGVDSQNLPIGVQFIANNFDEARLIQMASFIEKQLV
jgi:aspartyl-tRNA(Asn)/glutamyl-tRNA(Gln) amidotransferase subunit A